MAVTIIKNMQDVLRSGHVRRWHMNPEMRDCGEENAAHQWKTAMFVLWLEPNAPTALIIAALTHDVGELKVGDISYEAKRRPDCAMMMDLHREVEFAASSQMVTPQRLTGEQATILKIADGLAAWDMMTRHEPGLRHSSDWRDMIQDMERTILAHLGLNVVSQFLELVSTRHAELERMGK